jgi:hypothetical protein
MHAGKGVFASKYMGSIGFKATEKNLRNVAANAGRQYAMDLGNMIAEGRRINFAMRQLRSMGIDAEDVLKRGGRLTDDELNFISKRVSDQTQFRGDVFDLPMGWVGPYGRFLTQFKTFIYRQAKLLKDQVIVEARHGNFRPLMFMLSVYPAAGVTYDTLVNQAILGKEAPEGPLDWYTRGFTTIGALGIFETILTSGRYGQTSIYEFFGGPSVSELVKGANWAFTAARGNAEPSDVRNAALKRLPWLSPIGRRVAREQQTGYEGFEEYGSY